jgi:hypothetical protein
MGKMFPAGLDAARKQQDYTRQVFEENSNHTVHARSQNHVSATKTAVQVKKEQFERNRISETQSPREREQEQDVDMDTAEDHADDERQTPDEENSHRGGGVELEDQTHDTNVQKKNGARAVSKTIPETRTAQGSAAIGAKST